MQNQNNYLTDCDNNRESGFQSIYAGDIFFLLLLVFFVFFLMDIGIRASGLGSYYYGHEQFQEMLDKAKMEERSPVRTRLGLWSTGIGYPLMAILFPIFFKLRTAQSVSTLGIHTSRITQSFSLAIKAVFLLIPTAYIVQLLTVKLLQITGFPEINDHPLVELGSMHLAPFEWVLFFLSAVIGAAFLEEQLFRGLLQPWFLSRANGATQAAMASVIVTILFQFKDLQKSCQLLWANNLILENPSDKAVLLQALQPLLFSIAMAQIIHWVSQKESLKSHATIAGTGLLFGMVHSFAWPSPVPLTLLGYGLGLVYMKSGNLLGPILVHSMFNAIAWCVLFYQSS